MSDYIKTGEHAAEPEPPKTPVTFDPEVLRILRFFDARHLPPHLAAVSNPCADLAHRVVNELRTGNELVAGLRALLAAKDSFVRSALEKNTPPIAR